jgi:hypothetical protein
MVAERATKPATTNAAATTPTPTMDTTILGSRCPSRRLISVPARGKAGISQRASEMVVS